MKLYNVSALTSARVVSALPTPEASNDQTDWKYAVGWDGTALPATDIGSTLHNRAELEKRNVGGVYICTDTNWGGRCGYAVQPLHECIVLGSSWNKLISSFGPDACTFCTAYECTFCTAYESDDCCYNITGVLPADTPVGSFVYPGDATGGLGTDDPWNDRILSFICALGC